MASQDFILAETLSGQETKLYARTIRNSNAALRPIGDLRRNYVIYCAQQDVSNADLLVRILGKEHTACIPRVWEWTAQDTLIGEHNELIATCDCVVVVISPHYLNQESEANPWAEAWKIDPQGKRQLKLVAFEPVGELTGLLGSLPLIDVGRWFQVKDRPENLDDFLLRMIVGTG